MIDKNIKELKKNVEKHQSLSDFEEETTWLTCLLFSPPSSSSNSLSSTSNSSPSSSILDSFLSSSSSSHKSHNSLSHFSSLNSSITYSHFDILSLKCSYSSIELLKIDYSRSSCYESIIILLIFLYITSYYTLSKDENQLKDGEVYLFSNSSYTELEYKLSKDLLEKFIGSADLIKIKDNFKL